MNLNVLRYVIEVEKCRSITGAAKQLFISQPNLSRDIRELEEEIGFALFTRSSKGVIPTEKGREFLLLAKKAVRQYQMLENFCSHEEKDRLSLAVCVPKTGLFSAALAAVCTKHAKGRILTVDYREVGAMEAITGVSSRSCHLAIIRYPDRYERALFSLLKRKELSCETLCKYESVALMSERHPLSGTSVLTTDMLEQSTEVLCEDPELAAYLNESPEAEHTASRIHVQEHGSMLELLLQVPGTFAFTAPLPDAQLAKFRLVQKRCQGASRKMTDLLIYPDDYRPTRMETLLLEQIRLISSKA